MKTDLKSLSGHITVLVADDHPTIREGLTTILNSQEDIRVVASAVEGEEAIKHYYQFLPDVFILDLRLPKKDGLQVLDELMVCGKTKPRVIIMTTFDCEQAVFQTGPGRRQGLPAQSGRS
jgi:DNA-binding NarL/FixJ family response regulator